MSNCRDITEQQTLLLVTVYVLRFMEFNPLSLATVNECSPSRLPCTVNARKLPARPLLWPGTEARVHARVEYTVAGQVILNNFILRVFIFEICKALESGTESWISRDDWIPLLNLQWLILNVKCLLAPGTWAQQPSPETSGFGWSWAKQMRWTMAPWGEEDLFYLPQELWSLCSRTRCAGGFKVSYLLTLTILLWDSVVFLIMAIFLFLTVGQVNSINFILIFCNTAFVWKAS